MRPTTWPKSGVYAGVAQWHEAFVLETKSCEFESHCLHHIDGNVPRLAIWSPKPNGRVRLSGCLPIALMIAPSIKTLRSLFMIG